MNIYTDKRIVLTLDAGGTNFVFNAMQSGRLLFEPFTVPAHPSDLEKCLQALIDGFEHVKAQLEENPVAISFAFPGPADYDKGIIGDLPNFPAFKGGVAMGDMLKEHFGIPTFIQNDGNLYAYGEAIAGILPEINAKSTKRYQNLIGLTLGTGFGCGLVSNGNLVTGDNSIAGEIWLTSNRISPDKNTEEGVSTRAILNAYNAAADQPDSTLMPYDIFEIAEGRKEGSQQAAKEAFVLFGRHLGDNIANLFTLFDSHIVIGGGLTGASKYFMPEVMSVLNGEFDCGQKRTYHQVFNLEDPVEEKAFYETTSTSIKVPFSDKKVEYNPVQKAAVAFSELGASTAISIGAYAYALSNL